MFRYRCSDLITILSMDEILGSVHLTNIQILNDDI